jgi:hypothetical protein
MLKRLVSLAALIAALVSLASPLMAGGKVDIKTSALPDRIIAGAPVAVTFTVSYPNGQPVSRIKPLVIATQGDQKVVAHAIPAKKSGGYSAQLTLPSDGEWTIVVDSQYCSNTATMHGVKVLAAK